MPRKISKSDREVQLSALALADGYEFVGWKSEPYNAHGRVIFKCDDHGEWDTKAYSFVNLGSRCPGCSNNQKRPVSEIESSLSYDGAIFVQWETTYVNQNSRAVIRCDVHGEWLCTVLNRVNHHTGCPKCSGNYIHTRAEREAQFNVDGYSFTGWVNGYRNKASKALVRCPVHGEWPVSVGNFVNKGSRCPSCMKCGYDPSKPATLYALTSTCGRMVKIGISNYIGQRLSHLRARTPFDFTVHRELPSTDGSIPRTLEKMFHDQFPSAGLTGFDGATEWRQMSPDVTTWLDLLQ
jgi:hypothetical protein